MCLREFEVGRLSTGLALSCVSVLCKPGEPAHSSTQTHRIPIIFLHSIHVECIIPLVTSKSGWAITLRTVIDSEEKHCSAAAGSILHLQSPNLGIYIEHQYNYDLQLWVS